MHVKPGSSCEGTIEKERGKKNWERVKLGAIIL
jgi:hypothetical protein